MSAGWAIALGFTGFMAFCSVRGWLKPYRLQAPGPRQGQQMTSDETLRKGAASTVLVFLCVLATFLYVERPDVLQAVLR